MSLQFDQCDEVIQLRTITTFEHDEQGWKLLRARPTLKDASGKRLCSALPQNHQQFILIVAFAKRSISNTSSLEFLNSAAGIICAPVSWISKVEITDDGTEPQFVASPEQNRTFVDVDIWDILTYGYPGLVDADSLRKYIGSSSVNWTSDNVTDWMEFYDNNILLEATQNLFRRMKTLLPHYVLRQPLNESETIGHLMLSSRRLRVSPRVVTSMTALLATITLTAFSILLLYGRKSQVHFSSRNPASFLGTIIFIREHHIRRNPVLGLTPLQSEAAGWSACAFTPKVLRAWARASFTIWALNAMFWLIFAQKRSDTSNGLTTVDVADTTYRHLLWTAFPALVMLSVPLYVNACSITRRSLSILWLPSRNDCTGWKLAQSLLDMLGARVVYHSVRLRTFNVTLSQLLAFACGLLTTLTSGLLSTQEFTPRVQNTQLRQKTFFDSPSLSWDAIFRTREALQSFLLIRKDYNFTYPQNTYNDLIFPVLEDTEDIDHAPILSEKATIPAAQLQSSCTSLSTDEYTISIAKPSTPPSNNRKVRFYLLITCPNGTVIREMGSSIVEIDLHWGDSDYMYFGDDFPSTNSLKDVNEGCELLVNSSRADLATTRVHTYFWGAYSASKDKIVFISAWTCSSSWFEIPTDVSLVSSDGCWKLDPTQRPQPNQSTAKLWEPAFNISRVQYKDPSGYITNATAIPDVSVKTIWSDRLNGQLNILVSPFGDFLLEDFGNPDQEQKIIDKISQNLAFITAQLANIESRIYVDESSTTSGHPILPNVGATVNYKSQYRLYQSSTITYILITILSMVVLFNIWSLGSTMMRRLGKLRHSPLLDMNVKGLAPDGFGSLAAMADLLRDSNVWEYLPPTAESHSIDDLYEILANLHFRMSWFQSTREPPGRYFTIGVMGDKDFEFLGRKEDVKEEEVLPSPELAIAEGGSVIDAGPMPASEANSTCMIAEDGPEEGLSLASGNERMSSVDLTDEETMAVGERPSSGNGHRD